MNNGEYPVDIGKKHSSETPLQSQREARKYAEQLSLVAAIIIASRRSSFLLGFETYEESITDELF